METLTLALGRGVTCINNALCHRLMNNVRRLYNECRRQHRLYQIRQFVFELARNLVRNRGDRGPLRLLGENNSNLPNEMGDAGLASIEEPILAASFLAGRAINKKRLKARKALPSLTKLLKKKEDKLRRRASKSPSPFRRSSV